MLNNSYCLGLSAYERRDRRKRQEEGRKGGRDE